VAVPLLQVVLPARRLVAGSAIRTSNSAVAGPEQALPSRAVLPLDRPAFRRQAQVSLRGIARPDNRVPEGGHPSSEGSAA
jgi:hypothetical protein